MEKFKLQLKERERKRPRQLRREEKIPATVYGRGVASRSIQIDRKEFAHLPQAAYSHIIDLIAADGEPLPAIIRNIQVKPTTDEVLNIEFYRIEAGRKLTVEVPLKLIGSSEAIKLGGQLVELHQTAQIECLPKDIPDYIAVDLSAIKELDHGIYFSELSIPAEVRILNPGDEIVVRVASPKKITEEKPEAEELAAAGEAAAEEKAPAEAVSAQSESR